MKKMKCEVCGSTEIKKIADTTFECQSCGVLYSKEEAVKLLVELDDIPQQSFQKRTDDAFSSNDYFTHFDNSHKPRYQGDHISIFRDRYSIITDYEYYTTKEWVVDKAPYDEVVVTGYKCSVCGQTK